MKKILFILVLFFSQPSYADELDEVNLFLKKAQRLADTFDTSLTNTIADTAKMQTYRVYPHGLTRTAVLNGAQWKKLIIRFMPLAKLKGDRSTISNVKITKVAGGFKVKADRYSVLKCYTDKGYYLVLKRNNKGKLLVYEEYSETQPQSNCLLGGIKLKK